MSCTFLGTHFFSFLISRAIFMLKGKKNKGRKKFWLSFTLVTDIICCSRLEWTLCLYFEKGRRCCPVNFLHTTPGCNFLWVYCIAIAFVQVAGFPFWSTLLCSLLWRGNVESTNPFLPPKNKKRKKKWIGKRTSTLSWTFETSHKKDYSRIII